MPRSRRDHAEITPRSVRRYKLHIGIAATAAQLLAIALALAAHEGTADDQAQAEI